MMKPENELMLVELINGKTIMGEACFGDIASDSDFIDMDNPMMVLSVRTEGGGHGIQLQPWMGEKVAIRTTAIAAQLESDISQPLQKLYLEATTGIAIAGAGDLPQGGNLIQ